MLHSLDFMQGVPEITSNLVSTPSQHRKSHLWLREQRELVVKGPACLRQGTWVNFPGSVDNFRRSYVTNFNTHHPSSEWRKQDWFRECFYLATGLQQVDILDDLFPSSFPWGLRYTVPISCPFQILELSNRFLLLWGPTGGLLIQGKAEWGSSNIFLGAPYSSIIVKHTHTYTHTALHLFPHWHLSSLNLREHLIPCISSPSECYGYVDV